MKIISKSPCRRNGNSTNRCNEIMKIGNVIYKQIKRYTCETQRPTRTKEKKPTCTSADGELELQLDIWSYRYQEGTRWWC